jgi:hypothetical protein
VYEPTDADNDAAAWLAQRHERKDIEYRAETMLMKTHAYWVENASLTLLKSKWNGLATETER